ncbi:hypothetical protein O3P69_016996 [Scylla paramamosain]|uniref:BZIP domain-containing protein n=1 Tax=Scylla paramamosain TaxID=85552 RepID=A0AAW0TWQ2_SCYPA
MDIIDSTLADFAENDLKELWDSDYYAEALKVAGDVDWTGVLEGGGGGGTGGGGGGSSSGGSGGGGATGVVLNDRLITEASLGVISQLSSLGSFGGFSSLLNSHSPLEHAPSTADAADKTDATTSTATAAAADTTSPVVKVEHSYSLTSDSSHPHSPLSDLESECFPAIPISEAEGSGGGGVTTTTTTTTTTTATTTRFTTIITDRSATNSTSNTTTTASAPISITTTTSTTSAAVKKATNGASSASSSCASQSSSESGTYDILSAHPSLSPSALLAMPSLKTSMGLVRPSAVVVTQRSGTGVVHSSTSRIGLSSLTLRLPSSTSTATTSSTSPTTSSSPSSSTDTGFYLPPTPPSCSSSDSECGSQSPIRTPPLYETLTPQFCNPRKVGTRVSISTRNPINTPLISTQPKGATGAINLTEEEKRTLLSEGYSIPSRLPLTKAEEKSLKKIRRKIKNKISAQESRRKKKDYMDALERKVEKISNENLEYKRRIELLQTSNSQLLLELQQLQCLVEQDEKYRLRSSPIATLLS